MKGNKSFLRKYKNTLLVLVIILVLFILLNNPATELLIKSVGNLGLVGAFIAGIFFVSSFTVAIAGVALFFIAGTMPPLEVAIVAGLGAVIGDYLIFRFFKDLVFEELRPLFLKLGGSYLIKILRWPIFRFFTPILGAIIVASPFPDEVGIGLMGLSKIKTWQFLILSFVLNSLGIFALLSLAKSI